jgi:hypothetical protein
MLLWMAVRNPRYPPNHFMIPLLGGILNFIESGIKPIMVFILPINDLTNRFLMEE